MRKLPFLTEETRPFWTGGEVGELRMHHCRVCDVFFHPPAPVCRHCGGLDVGPKPVSGRGRVVSYTVNHQAWTPELSEPYVVAIVELDDQTGLRLLTNIVGCPPDAVASGMAVKVVFEAVDDVWIPLFERAA